MTTKSDICGRLYQINIVERRRKSFLVSARNTTEAMKILDMNLITLSGVIALEETDIPKVEEVIEVFPICIEEDVMSPESKYYKK